MRKREVVKIDDKEFTIKELTVQQIIEVFERGLFLTDKLKGSTAQPEQLPAAADSATADDAAEFTPLSTLLFMNSTGLSADLNKFLNLCCDFVMDDIMKLAPSEVSELVEAFKRVNKDFLSTLKVLGVAEALAEIRNAALVTFLKTLAI